MKKVIFLAILTLFSSRMFAQTPVCATGDCSDGGLFSMQYCIVTPLCGGFEGDITANITTTMPNCTGCVEILLTGTDNPNTRTANVNIASGAATASFANIPEGFYVLTAKTPIVPTPPPGSTKTSYVCSKLIQINAVDTLSVNGTVTPDPCPVVSPFQGAISITASGGTPPYTYDWADIAGTNDVQNRSGLAPGSYTVTVRDVNNCSKTQTFTISEQKPTVNLSANPNPICQASFPPNVTITWTATPGPGWTPHATPYSWDGGPFGTANTQSVVATAFNIYTKTVQFRDINGCISDPVSVPVPADIIPTGSVSPATANVCPGQTVSLSGLITQCSMIGATPCQFSFDNGGTYQTAGDNDSVFTVNAPQTVTVRIRNQTGCVSDPITVQLDTLGKPRVTYTVNPNPICPNNSSNITINFICNPSNCAGYQYDFNNTGLTNVPVSATVSFMSPTVAATTAFPLQVVSTCTLDTTITVQVFPDNTNINAPDTIVCANNVGPFGPVTLTATGFSSITDWTPIPGVQTTTSVTVVPSVNTTYTVSGTDLNGCPRTASQDVVSLAQPVVTTPTPVNHCEGTTSLLTASGGLTYDWTDASFAPLFTGNPYGVSPTANTTYNVIGTDANGCKDSAQVNVVLRAKPTGSANASPSSICAGNTSDITITVDAPFVVDPAGGYSYNDGASFGTNTPFTGGPYTSTTTFDTRIRDQYGCISDAIPVTITVAPFTAAVTGATALCSTSMTGTATVTVTGGSPTYEYSIDAAGGPFTSFSTAGNSQGLTNLAAGPHTIYVRDAGNICNTSTPFTVSTPPPLVLSTTAINDVRCKGETNGSIVVSVSGGTALYDLFLDGAQIFNDVAAGSQTYSNLAGGVSGSLTYDLLLVDANSCSTTVDDVPINEPATALAAPSITPPSFCFGTTSGVFTMSPDATGGWGSYTYTFNGTAIVSGGTRTGLAAGTYPLIVNDSKGCSVSTTVTLTSSPELFSNVSTTPSDCGSNGAIDFQAATGGTPGYTYSLDGVTYGASIPADMNPVTVNTTATLYVRDAQNCVDDTTVTVLNIPRGIPIVSIVPPTCPGGTDGSITIDSVSVKIPGGEPFDYELFTDANPLVSVGTAGPSNANVSVTFSSLSGGNHILQMSDQACADYAVDSFRVYTSPTTYIVVTTPAPVNNGYAAMFVPQPSPFTTSSIALASDVFQNTGTVILYNLQGGTPLAGPAYQMSIDNPSALVNRTLLDTLGGQKYVAFTNLAPGPHTVYIRDANGCSDTILIQVPGKFFIPNLVTPNADQSNDVFEIVSLPDNSELKLYNRWGDRVFESSNYDNKYDFKGLSDGVYYYDLEFNTGTHFKGWVQVLR